LTELAGELLAAPLVVKHTFFGPSRVESCGVGKSAEGQIKCIS